MKKIILFIFSIICSLSLNAQCDDNGNYWNQSWVSCSKSNNPNSARAVSFWLLYEFDEPQYIDSTHIWNANRDGESGLGAKEVLIDYSTNGSEWDELGQFTFPKAPETNNYEGFDGPSFNGLQLKKILITVLSTHDDSNCASIAEVQFKIDQTACFGIVDACGVCDGPGKTTWFLDADGDGLGDANNAIEACEQPDGYVDDNNDACDNGNLGWSDVAPVFENRGCTNCHGGGARGGLDLRSYTTLAAGGDICGTSLLAGTKLVDIITKSAYEGCGTAIPLPAMNSRVSDPINDDELDKIQEWIDGGAPESCDNFITSTSEVFDLEVNIYPNPTTNAIYIHAPEGLNYEAIIYSLDGKRLMGSTNPSSLQIKSLPSGFYLVEINDLDSPLKVVKKIVKMK